LVAGFWTYAPAVRRAVIVNSIGLTVVVVLAWFLP
jgi:hypothetical protein